jgi:hypothetical protein
MKFFKRATFAVLPLILSFFSATASDDKAADKAQLDAMPTVQRDFAVRCADVEAELAAAVTKQSKSGNSIATDEANKKQSQLRKDAAELADKPIEGWIGLCSSVSLDRRSNAYQVRIDCSLIHVNFTAKTNDTKMVEILKTMEQGDILRFSGKSNSRTASTNVRDFELSSIEVVKKRSSKVP